MKTTAELKKQEAARGSVYRRLADAFRLPGADLPMFLAELKTALANLKSNARADAVRLYENYRSRPGSLSLEVDFTQLFVGPFLLSAPPYGSIYLEGKRRLMGESTIEARQQYLRLGFDLSTDFKDAPDHITTELEFMYVLIHQSLNAIEALDYSLYADMLRHQHQFLGMHLGEWIPAFTAKVIEHAQTHFYRDLAITTQQFIAEEVDTISEFVTMPETETLFHHDCGIGEVYE